MKTLYDLAQVIRSKNAGPLYITIDILFDQNEAFDRVVSSEILTPDLVSRLYGVEIADVEIFIFEPAKAIKITFPRIGATSGAIGDKDVYGAQQHGPISAVCIQSVSYTHLRAHET